MKLEKLVIKLEDGDVLQTNMHGIFIEHEGRLYVSNMRPSEIPKNGVVTFQYFGLSEEGHTSMTYTYRSKKSA